MPQHQPAHPNWTRKKETEQNKRNGDTKVYTTLPWPCRPPVPDTSSQGLEEDTCASACHTFPCNWSCHCIMSQRRHHPVNKNGGKGEEREEVEGKQKKKKLRKVGLEVELKRHKRINQTCVCGGCFCLFCKSVSVWGQSSQQSTTSPRHASVYTNGVTVSSCRSITPVYVC